MEWIDEKPDIKTWTARRGAEPTDSRDDLEARSGYSGRPGRHLDEANEVFGPHVRALERAITRYTLHRTEPMYPPEPDEGPIIEQTPFGPVTASPSFRNDPNFMNSGKASFIRTRDTDWEPPSAEEDHHLSSEAESSSAEDGAEPGGFLLYSDLAAHMRASNKVRQMARAVLSEVYRTLAARMGGEEDKDRQDRSIERQPEIAATWKKPEHRRTMAILYALTILSEEQRSAGGKAMRSALRLIAAGRLTPEEAFTQIGAEDPAVVQTLPGGMRLLRFSWRGGGVPTPNQRLVHEEHSESSGDDDDPDEMQTRYLARADLDPADEDEIKRFKNLGARRRAHLSTRVEDAGEESDDERDPVAMPLDQPKNLKRKLVIVGARKAEPPAKFRKLADDESAGTPRSEPIPAIDQPQNRKRKLVIAGARTLGRPEKLRRLANDESTDSPRSEPIHKSKQRRIARPVGPRPAEKRGLDEEESQRLQSRTKRQKLAPKL